MEVINGVKDRYSRQVLVIGQEGQEKLARSCAVVIGCGALGTVAASILVRAGVGKVRIVDRDFIEYHNLQRQVLFDEEDVASGLPKAEAARRRLEKINSAVLIEGIVADVDYTNVESLIRGVDVIVDGLDNFETRMLINDAALKHGVPWIYGGAIATCGMTTTVIPGKPPCFRCFTPDPDERGLIETCDTAGVISPAPFTIGSLQAAQAIKLLTGAGEINRVVITVDAWDGTFQHLNILPRADCPACSGRFEFLEGRSGKRTTVLCGQNAVQISSPGTMEVCLKTLAARLRPLGDVTVNKFLVRFSSGGHEMVVFPDGRAIISSTSDEALARSLYARYVGT